MQSIYVIFPLLLSDMHNKYFRGLRYVYSNHDFRCFHIEYKILEYFFTFQEHFLKLKIENAMGSATPTVKQISYLKKLGCTVTPTSRLHASHLIEQYKSL
ncbi:hypothetical protein LR48_Vigan09g107400 [Vigna angularis]|uniref:Uncharacterized protein n=1 Tax=Phaseolus angularis TaxID=3914 RepID=A0A0L9VBH6_PHAAN|nr:hypothetical protein LR48_Vigan09g107400 [Vigna angularis]